MSITKSSTLEFNGCVHCIPNNQGKSVPLMKNTLNHKAVNSNGAKITERITDITVINREDKLENTFVLRNIRTSIKNIESSKYTYKKVTTQNGAHVLYCPCCGRPLADVIPKDHPLKQANNKKISKQSKLIITQ